MPSLEEVASLEKELEAAGERLEVKSGVGSASSEGRDRVRQGLRVQEELEWKSNASSVSSSVRARKDVLEKEGEQGGDIPSRRMLDASRAQFLRGGEGPLVPRSLLVDYVRRTPLQVEKMGSGGAAGGGGGGGGSNVGSGINSSLSNSNSDATAQSSSVGLGLSNVAASSSGSSAAVYETLTVSQKELVESMMADLFNTHGRELAEMQSTLAASRLVEMKQTEDNEELVSSVSKMRKQLLANENLQSLLMTSRDAASKAQDERDDLKDRIVGLEARHSARLERHQQDLADLKKAQRSKDEEQAAKFEKGKGKLVEELNAAMKDLAQSKKLGKTAQSERDVLRRAENVAKKTHEAEIQNLQLLLDAAQREIERRDKADVRRREGQASGGEDFKEAHRLEEMLGDSRESNRKLNTDLAELRIEMLQLQQVHEGQLGDLQALLEVTNVAKLAQAKGRAGSRKPMGKGPGPKLSALSSIDEEGDEIGSQAASAISGQVSSDGEGVGDLTDFDDYGDRSEWLKKDEVNVELIARLRDELHESGALFKQLQDDAAGKDAEHIAKISRLLQQMQGLRSETVTNEDEISRLKQASEDAGADYHAEMAAIQKQLLSLSEVREASMQRLEDQELLYVNDLEEMKQQLAFALEAKRLAANRLDDTRRELEAVEIRHARVVADLQARLQLAMGGCSEEAENDVLVALRSVEEERNILRNELECERVHWQGQLEREQQEHAVDVAKLREAESMLMKEREISKQLEEKMNDLQRQLVASRKATDEAVQRANQQAAVAREAERQAKEAAGSSFLGFLRCPSRSPPQPHPLPNVPNNVPTTIGGADGSSSSSSQTVLWQVLSAMRGVTALLCSEETLRILDASKKAFSMWGSAALRGSSLYTLVFDQATAAWLKMEIATPAGPAFLSPGGMQGFWLRELGCIEFRSKLGSAFDSSVICARLPEEPRVARPAVMLVIVEPMEEDRQQGLRQNPQQLAARPVYQRGPASRASSVASEDITANDSVSNVNARW